MLNRIFSRTRFRCPDEGQLAAYVDQQLIGAERERVESHIAKCDSCLEQVGFLTKQSQVVAQPAPLLLLHRAEQLKTAASENSPLEWKWVTVAAAICIVAIGVAVWREARPPIQERPINVATAQKQPAQVVPDSSNSDTETAVRSLSSNASLPVVLSPQAGATVHASDFIIRWEPIPNASAYEVRLVTANGDLVWRKRVHENSVNPPHATLRPGVKYFVWVRALLPDGKTQQSAAVGFIGG